MGNSIMGAGRLQIKELLGPGGTTAMTIDDDGNITNSGHTTNTNLIKFKMYLTSNFSLTQQAWKTLPINTTTNSSGGQAGWNTGNCWDTTNYRFYPQRAGYYHIGAQATLADTNASYILLSVLLNGYGDAGSGTELAIYAGVESGDASSWHYAFGSSVHYLSATDFISFRVYQNDSGANNVAATASYTQAWGYQIT